MWTIRISKVAITLHPEDPHGPEVGAHPRNTPSHSRIYFFLPHSSLATARRPLRTRRPRHPKYGQLAGIPLGPSNPTPTTEFGDGRTPLSPRKPRARKRVFALSARRYGLKTMNYSGVVSQSTHHSSECGTTGYSWPVHSPAEPPRTDTGMIGQGAGVESPVLLANPHRTVMCRGGWS